MKSNEKTPSHRILVIDDNPSIHEDFRKILLKKPMPGDELQAMESVLFGRPKPRPIAAASFEIDSAFQGREGLEMAQQAQSEGRPYVLAFVDGRMPPGWDGIETIKHLWQTCPDLQVVFCTAYSDYSWQEIRGVLGESDSMLILKKPFDNVEVLQLTHALTRKWELNREVQARIDDLGDTARQETEEKERTGALLEAAIEHSPAGVVITDTEAAKIIWANPEALNICDPTCLLSSAGRPDLHTPDWQPLRANGAYYPYEEFPLSRAVMEGEIIQGEEFILRNIPEGRDKWVLCNAAPIRKPDGVIIGGILLFQDITERKDFEMYQKRLQAQLNEAQRMESVGLLAGGIAHEFNNALMAMMGNLELLRMDLPEGEGRARYFDVMKDSGRRMSRLTDQLLAYARGGKYQPRNLRLGDFVMETLSILRHRLSRGVKVETSFPGDISPIRADHTQMEVVLSAILCNADEAIEGEGFIKISARNQDIDDGFAEEDSGLRPGSYVCLVIEDDGKGMNEGTREKIFDPFFTTKFQGRGMGMAAVYGIVKSHDGWISVDSELGKGTVVRIYFPKAKAEERQKETPQIEPPGGKGTILLIEDEDMIIDVTEAMLEKLGYRVMVAKTGKQAVRIAETAEDVDLVLLDIKLPDMEGGKVYPLIMEARPNLKVIVCSGYSMDGPAREILDAGAQGFLQKPFSYALLSEKLKEVLEGS